MIHEEIKAFIIVKFFEDIRISLKIIWLEKTNVIICQKKYTFFLVEFINIRNTLYVSIQMWFQMKNLQFLKRNIEIKLLKHFNAMNFNANYNLQKDLK